MLVRRRLWFGFAAVAWTVGALALSTAVGAQEVEKFYTFTDGKVDRTKLAARVLGDADALKRLEDIVHPLVHEA